MSTVGTMYDETVKFGFGKLLQTQTLSNVSAAVFVTPFTLGFHTFLFDLVNLYPVAASDSVLAQVSFNAGASWAGDAYYWGLVYSTSNDPASVGSQANHLVGARTDAFQVSGSGYNYNAYVGEVIVNCTPGKNAQFQWHTSCVNAGYLQHNLFGGGVRDGPCNAVRFLFGGGNISSGIIRCYGLRLGT